MQVIHILQDGTQVKDITGHVITNESVYAVINALRKEKNDEQEKAQE